MKFGVYTSILRSKLICRHIIAVKKVVRRVDSEVSRVRLIAALKDYKSNLGLNLKHVCSPFF